MKKFFVTMISGSLFALPALALAASVGDVQTQLQFILARNSALVADQPVNCFLATSKADVKVGEPFTFIWFSTGANSQTSHNGTKLDPYGVQTIALDHAATWTYTLKFYDAVGNAVPCSVTIHATQ